MRISQTALLVRPLVVALLLVAVLAAPLPALLGEAGEGTAEAAAQRRKSKLIRPGKSLPTGEACANRTISRPEIRPDNADENAFVPTDGVDFALTAWTLNTFGMADAADELRLRIDGDFTGTTDEILQWGACKWGFKRNVVRAMAVAESAWRMSKVGDLDKGTPSYGILQVKEAFHPGTAPASVTSTAFNVDYALGYVRACYEGHIDWLSQQESAYGSGDLWGCVGHWFSGGWKDDGALGYVGDVKHHARLKIWRQSEFDRWS